MADTDVSERAVDPERAVRATNADLPSFSAIVEWENVRLSERARAEAMLQGLAGQIRELGGRIAQEPELIILYDPAAIDPQVIEGLCDTAFGAATPIERRLMPMRAGHYYEQKNEGARLAAREFVLFIDSDVVPEPGWLEALIGSFRDPEIEVVCGNTYIEPRGLYWKAFALFWFFPLRRDGGGLERTGRFFANNVAFRRAVFLEHRFPDVPLVRGQCAILADALAEGGHAIHIQTDARVSHPPPNGAAHFFRRALCQGHGYQHRFGGGVGGAFRRWRRYMRRTVSRIVRHRREVGLGPAGAVAAIAIGGTYYTLCWAGDVITRYRPSLVRDRFPV
jgi:hypothetical protein